MTLKTAKQLSQHLEDKLLNFNRKLLSFEKREIISFSDKIAVVFDVYRRLREYDLDEYEALRLFTMTNPLEAFAIEWALYKKDFKDDNFEQLILTLLSDEDFKGNSVFISRFQSNPQEGF